MHTAREWFLLFISLLAGLNCFRENSKCRQRLRKRRRCTCFPPPPCQRVFREGRPSKAPRILAWGGRTPLRFDLRVGELPLKFWLGEGEPLEFWFRGAIAPKAWIFVLFTSNIANFFFARVFCARGTLENRWLGKRAKNKPFARKTFLAHFKCVTCTEVETCLHPRTSKH